MEQHLNRFIDTYTKAIKENNAAIFAGAGLSIPAGFVNWKNLLRDSATALIKICILDKEIINRIL
ncbi:MAG: hypothetical protein NTX22_14485 [Ignavibacteriales bacterium]|nr:hypothetical protein [Ignavibacteriales bacterium]